MNKKAILDFKAQAEQMLNILECRLDSGNREAAVQLLVLKFKTLYEQGVIGGRAQAKKGNSPYTALD